VPQLFCQRSGFQALNGKESLDEGHGFSRAVNGLCA
jgi:hypothetical protein